jgi:hypothetical protein
LSGNRVNQELTGRHAHVAKGRSSCDILGVTSVGRKLSFALLVFGPFLVLISCQTTSLNYRNLEIGPELHLLPSGRISAEPDGGSYYFFFYAKTGLTTVDHFQKKAGVGSRERLLYLETNRNLLLDRTVKYDQILKGRFGTVYVEKTCFYTRPIAESYSYVSVRPYANQLDHEVPSELSRPPESLPLLTSVSIVRVFRAAPEFLVVSANYEPNGELGGLHIDGAKGGDWVHSDFVPEAHDSFVQGIPKPDALTRYGIPAHIDVQEFTRSHRLSLAPAALAEEATVINLHYGFNKFIWQDELKDGTISSSRFLQPSVTPEEEVLDPLCESRLSQQRSMGLPTVE